MVAPSVEKMVLTLVEMKVYLLVASMDILRVEWKESILVVMKVASMVEH